MNKGELYKVRRVAISELWETEVYGFLELTRQMAKVTNMTPTHIRKRVQLPRIFYMAYYLGFRKVAYRFHGTEQIFDVEKWCRKLHVAMKSKPKKYKVVIKRRKVNG